MRDVTEAHFLHQRSGLEAVLRPPVSQPTALAWIPGREELLVCGRDGTLSIVDPVLGTRVIATDLGEASVLAVHPDRKRFFVVSRQGEWILGKIGVGVEKRGRHAFMGTVDGFWLGEYAVLAGDIGDGSHRLLVILGDGAEKMRLPLPARTVPVAGEDGKLLLARSTDAGLQVVKATRQAAFPPGESTAHRLRPCGKYILGFTQTGVALWERPAAGAVGGGGIPRSMRLPDLTAGDIGSAGEYLGLGTKTGAVALAAIARLDARAKPHLVKAFDGPVTSVAFSDRGQWLATGAEGLQIWTWEE